MFLTDERFYSQHISNYLQHVIYHSFIVPIKCQSPLFGQPPISCVQAKQLRHIWVKNFNGCMIEYRMVPHLNAKRVEPET